MLQLRKQKLFDVRNKSDVEVFRKFLIENKWGAEGCPFEIEYPWTSVPDMIKDKLVRHHLKIKD